MIHCRFYILAQNVTHLHSVSEILEMDRLFKILAKSWTLAQMIPDIDEIIDVWMESDIILRLWDYLA